MANEKGRSGILTNFTERMSTKTTRYKTLHEAADDIRHHPRTLRRWCEQGKIPFLRLGRRYLFLDSDIAALRTKPLATREAIIA